MLIHILISRYPNTTILEHTFRLVMVKAVRQRSHTSESVHSGGYMMIYQPFSPSLSLCKIQHYRCSFQQDRIHWLTNRRKNMSFSLKQSIGITDISQRWIVSWCHVPCLNDTQDLVLDVRITPRLFKERNVYVSEKPHHHCPHKNPIYRCTNHGCKLIHEFSTSHFSYKLISTVLDTCINKLS